MADGVAEAGDDLAVSAHRAHGELGDFVVKVDEAFDDDAAVAHAATGHGVVPGFFHVLGAVDFALTLARAAHHGLDDAGVADATVNRSLQLLQRIAELVGAGGQAQRFGGQHADALAVHGQAGGAGGGDDAHHTSSLQLFEHRGGNGFDLGHHQVRALGFDQRLELGRVAHGDGARVVGHLLAGGVVVAVYRNGFHAQALQRDQHFLAQLPRAEQHDFGGVGRQGGSEGGHGQGLQTVDVKKRSGRR